MTRSGIQQQYWMTVELIHYRIMHVNGENKNVVAILELEKVVIQKFCS